MTTHEESPSPLDRGPSEGRGWRATMLAWGAALVVALLAAVLVANFVIRPDRAVDHVFEVPLGTGVRSDAGERAEILPRVLRLAVNDLLVVVNRDERDHLVGPFTVRKGETLRHRFISAGRYQGACTLHAEGQVSILVQ